MAVNVGEAFLHDAENRGLRFSWQAPEILGEVEIDSDFAAQRETIHIPAKSRGESRLVEQRRVQQVGNRAHFGGHFMDQIFAVGQRICRFGQALDIAAYGRKIHIQGRQHLSHTVVQFARDAAPLIVLQLEETSRQAAQILIGRVEVRRAFPHAAFEFSLCLEQLLVLAPARFRHGYDNRRTADEDQQQNGLGNCRNGKRM